MSLRSLKLFLIGLFFQLATGTAVIAQDEKFDNTLVTDGEAIVIEMKAPKSPRNRARRLQAGWTKMSYVVTPDGRAIDPIIIDSSGGIGFEEELRKVSELWTFEVSDGGAELPLNLVEATYSFKGHGKGMTRRFSKRTRSIMTALQDGDIAKARESSDATTALGGWNLYESTMLWLMLGRVAGAEDDLAEKLEMYQRGLAVSNKKSLPASGRGDLLEKIFNLQNQFGHYAAALQTFEALGKVRGSKERVATLTPIAEEISEKLTTQEVVVAKATIANPCDCDAGEPLWFYEPQRRTFSFDNIQGDVSSFEARCQRQRVKGEVTSGREWELPDDWGSCQVFVFGADGATFDFLGHMNSADALLNEAVAQR